MALSTPTGERSGLVTSSTAEGNRLLRTVGFGGERVVTSVDARGTVDDPAGAWWRAYLRGDQPTVESERPTVSRPLRALELFCGPGGLALGFAQACSELGRPVQTLAAVDQDEEAVAVYRQNHRPIRTSTRSVSTLVDYQVKGSREDAVFHYEPEMIEDEWTDLVGQVDVVLAGPPCQGHSNLNNRTRRNDRRNELYLTVPAIAVALGAPVVIIENVPAVVHDRLGVVAATTALLSDAGYHVERGVLDASRMGWPQKRSRFFLVARRGSGPIPLAIVGDALADEPRSLMWAIGDLEDEVDVDFMTAQPEFSSENRRRIDWLFDNDAHDLALSERPECHQEGTTYTSVYGRLYPDRPAPTITTGFMTPGRGRYVHPTRRRVLTPREAARLQGFPDTYDFMVGDEEPSKLKLGKWIGDAVPMPLGYAAGLSALLPGLGAGARPAEPLV